MKKSVLIVAAALSFGIFTNKVFAQTQQQDTTRKTTNTTTNAAATDAQTAGGDVVAVIAGSADYSGLTNVLKTANLESSLKASGPYTVFAPNNAALSKIPKPKLDSLMKDPAGLAKVVKVHVVNGKYTKADIIKALSVGKGKASLKTIDGESLTLSVNDKSNLQVSDAQGDTALVTSFDLLGTNGVVHGINGALLPK
jgi:uncharacterized surface protein with fasciclin (FAS1) repeats